MRRSLTIAFASLLVLALIAPAAGAATQIRHFQDRGVNGDNDPHGGEIGLDVIYKNKTAKGKFTPRSVKLYEIEVLPITCETGGSPGSTFVAFGPGAPIKLAKAKFNYEFAADFDAGGGISGKAIKTKERIQGKINVFDANPGGGVTGCTTDGPRTYDATPCRTANEDLKLPVCRVGGGS